MEHTSYSLNTFPKRVREKLEESNGCWLWKAYRTWDGYGRFKLEGKMTFVHRYSYQMYKGVIDEGLYVLHKCDVRNCVNPEHLFLGTHQDNMRDRNEKGRTAKGWLKYPGQTRGDRHWRCKVSEGQIMEMRKKYQGQKICREEMKKITELYNIHSSHVYRILKSSRRKEIV